MSTLINGRTPEEIKRDIDRCSNCNGCAGCWNIENTDCVETNMTNALALIEHLESERDAALAKVPKWISVEERLPEERGIYLAHVMPSSNKEGLYALVCTEYFNPEDGWATLPDLYEVTHWMPLPEPPKEGE